MGATHALNEPYANLVRVAAMVSEIDGVPLPFPTNQEQIYFAIDKVGDEGYAAVLIAFERKVAATTQAALVAANGGPPDPLLVSAS